MARLTRRRFLQVAATTAAGALVGCGGLSPAAPADPRRAAGGQPASQLQLFLADHGGGARAGARLLAGPGAGQHRGHGLRLQRGAHRRRARLGAASRRRATGAGLAGVPARCAAGDGPDRLHRLSRLFLSLPRHEQRYALPRLGALDRRHDAAADGCAPLRPVFRRHGCRRGGDPYDRGRLVRARRVELGPGQRPGRLHGLAAGNRIPVRGLDRLQRGDPGLPAGPGLTGARRRDGCLGRLDLRV